MKMRRATRSVIIRGRTGGRRQSELIFVLRREFRGIQREADFWRWLIVVLYIVVGFVIGILVLLMVFIGRKLRDSEGSGTGRGCHKCTWIMERPWLWRLPENGLIRTDDALGKKPICAPSVRIGV